MHAYSNISLDQIHRILYNFSLIQELSDETVVEVGKHGTKVRLIFNLNDA